MKRILLPLMLISSLCFAQDDRSPCLTDLPSHFSPENTVVIFDFHNVLGYTDWTKGLKTLLWDNPDRFSRLSRITSYGIRKMIHDKSIKNSSLLEYLDSGEPGEAYEKANLELVNAYWIDPQSEALVKKLHNEGYKLILFSNTPESTMKFQENAHPELFGLFDKKWYRKVGSTVTKKSPEAFEQVKKLGAEALGHTPQRYVFVDDTKKNIKLGEEAGICGILFKTVKQTEKVLTEAGILQ
ncbi:HAD-IA family hydrolase [bacterium]|jgi:HAD superfamily hydrolase (TIGR01509 family)|nr:HAD-IA family hydrolase [bacterium]MBT5014933.1 HAD-IA family hydrolase [bacterium]